MDFHLNLHNDKVNHAHPAEPIKLDPSTTVREAFRRMKEGRTGAVLVCHDGELVGIFTERDALRMMADRADLDAPLENHMAQEPVTLSACDTVGTAISRMSRGGYRRLPIVDDAGTPQGMLKTSGILHYLVEHFPAVVYNLPPTPHHTTQSREGA